MAIQSTYPTTLDAAPTDRASGNVIPSVDWNLYADAITQLENEVGVVDSAVTTSLVYMVTNSGSVNPGHHHSSLYDSSVTNVVVSAGTATNQMAVSGVPYNWPASIASAGFLMNDHLGNLTWGGTFKVRMYRGLTQAIGTASLTEIVMNAESYDTGGIANTTTGRITPGVAGYYYVGGRSGASAIAAGNVTYVSILVNGTESKRGDMLRAGGTGDSGVGVSCLIYLDADDYVSLGLHHNYGSNRNILWGTTQTYLFLWGPL